MNEAQELVALLKEIEPRGIRAALTAGLWDHDPDQKAFVEEYLKDLVDNQKEEMAAAGLREAKRSNILAWIALGISALSLTLSAAALLIP